MTNPLKRSLRSIRDGKIESMAIVLEIAIGAPMQCTKNVSRSMKLANGTIGHVVSVQNNEHDIMSTTEVNGITIIQETLGCYELSQDHATEYPELLAETQILVS